MAYAVSYQVDYREQQSRLTTFFRLILLIPVMVVGFFWGIVGFFTIVAAWFALLITGRYPAGLYEFNSGLLRIYGRFGAYTYLQTDQFPPLGNAAAPDYPVRVAIAPAQQTYSRVTVFFRGILAIPVYLVMYVFSFVQRLIALLVWFAVVFTGRMPRGLFGILNYFIGFTIRGSAYAVGLLTDAYPPFGDTDPPQYPDAMPPGYPPPVGGQVYGAPPTYGQPPAPDQPPTYGQPSTYGQPPAGPPVYGQPPATPPPPPPSEGGVDWNKPS